MTDQAPAADAPAVGATPAEAPPVDAPPVGASAGACIPVRERRLRYAWQAALAAAVLVLTAALSMGDRPYEAERRVFAAVNGLPTQLDDLLIPVMQAGALAAVFAAGVLALIARRPRLAGLVVLAGGSAWILASWSSAWSSGAGRWSTSTTSSSTARCRWARGFHPATRR